MSGDFDRIYDSFVIRVWHDGTITDVRRVEIEHVQTGQTVTAAVVPLAWIVEQIGTLLLASRFPDEPRSEAE